MTVDKELFGDTLPTYLTRFVGRDREIATVLSLMLPGRLVTVCGVGGAGKTRLAIEAAKRHRARSAVTEDGGEVYWVPLGAVVDPTQVPAAVATGIGLAGQDRPIAQVLRALRDRQALLVLDNCEHVAGVCRELLASLLPACPKVTVLATSRVPLELPGEEVFAVPPMGGAGLRSDPFESDAIALFLDRATSVAGAYALTEHNAKTLGDICEVLHGLPLGIELAASWIPVLSPHDLLDHLREADTTLASDTAVVEDRHRSRRDLGQLLALAKREGAYGVERFGDLRWRFHPRSSRDGCWCRSWRTGRVGGAVAHPTAAGCARWVALPGPRAHPSLRLASSRR